MPDAPAITAENLAETRRIAEDMTNLCHAIPDRRNTNGMPAEVVDVLNAAGDRISPVDWLSTTPERLRVMSRWCEMLPLMHLAGIGHEADTADWHWSAVRCFIAAAGFDGHAQLARQLCETFPQCPLRVDETEAEWMAALEAAHHQSGLPACIGRLPWMALHTLPEIDPDDLATIDSKWLFAAGMLHLLKHIRIVGDVVRVVFLGEVRTYRITDETNDLGAQIRLGDNLRSALRLPRADMRKANLPYLGAACRYLFNGVTINRLLAAAPLSNLPGPIIAGAFTRVLSAPSPEGWFQHGLRLKNAWSAADGRTRGFEGDEGTIMGYAWNIAAFDEAQESAYTILAESVPATYDIASPFEILTHYQPNFTFDWCDDVDAQHSLIDALLVVAVMRQRVSASRREFPIVWVLPSDPTPAASTNQGKTTAVGALAGCMTPGIIVSRPPDTNSAPDMRVIAGMIREVGTVALDEWAMPKTQAHPLSARNLQSLATGGALPLGEVLANNPTPVMLRQPIVASAKCLTLPEDIKNRSLFLFLRQLTQEERQNPNHFNAMISGEVALRMRLAALSLIDQFELTRVQPVAGGSLRFGLHTAVAAELYTLRTGKSRPEALAAIVTAHEAMRTRAGTQAAQADESGLMAEMDSGEALNIRASDLFNGLGDGQLNTMADLMKANDNGRCTASGVLNALVKSDPQSTTLRAMLMSRLGTCPRASDRALGLAFGYDLHCRMAREGATWSLPDSAGITGWRLRRSKERKGSIFYRLECTNPASTFFPVPDTE